MTADSKEQLHSQPNSETADKGSAHTSELRESKDIQKGASDVLKNGESDEGSEDSESADGNVSENASDDKSKAGQGGGKKKYTDDEIEAIRAKLLASAPPHEMMVKEIRKKLFKEEHQLEKECSKYLARADKNAYELSVVVRKMRQVKAYLAIIAHATYEMVKHLWLKIVHGV